MCGVKKEGTLSAILVNNLFIYTSVKRPQGFPGGSDSKESTCNAGDLGSILVSQRSPGEGNGSPLQCFAWEIQWTEEPGGLESMGSKKSATESNN